MRALDDQVRAGKILYLGVSDTPAWVISRANTLAAGHGWTEFAGLQAPYSLLQRDAERELLPMAENLGLTVAAWSPLADGILSGKYTSRAGQSGPGQGSAGPGVAGQPSRVDPASLTETQHAVAGLVAQVADELGATPAQVAIAWIRARPPAVCPVIGARRRDQLLDNLAAADLDLPADALARLDTATQIDLGFPSTFIRGNTPWVFGAAALPGS